MPNSRYTLQATACAILLSAASAAAAPPARLATEIILHAFAGPDGAHPLGGVIVTGEKDKSPVLYGTAYSGGINNGDVFKIEKGAFSVVHNFKAAEGKFPQSGLTLGPDGTFYGTLSGGDSRVESKDGYGALFSMTPEGRVKVLHKFQGPEGGVPIGPVSIDAAGDLLGTTRYGGKSMDSGTLYKYATDGTTTALVDFSDTPHCQGGLGSVTVDTAGNIFSTAWMSLNQPYGCVFEYNTANHFKLVHRFDNSKGGRETRGGVAIDAAGNLYGANYYRGNFEPGTIYKIAPDGTETVLHRFKCGDDGGYPYGSLLLSADGVLYGTGSSCGTGGGGVVFSYNIAKNFYRVLYSFQESNQNDGYLPVGPLSMDAKGNLYGTTEYGGADNLGVVFEIKR